MEVTLENYSFKKAMQMLINDNIIPILSRNNFIKYKKNHFVREKNSIVQIISFWMNPYNLYAYAYVLPIYVPCDYILNYGIELTGTSGCHLLSGKYFTTIYEPEKENVEIQFNHYKNKHKPNFGKLVKNIVEGVLPEMNRIDSLEKLIFVLENEKETLFGNRYGTNRKINDVDNFTFAVYRCLCGDYLKGKNQLLLMKRELESSGALEYELENNIYRCIAYLLPTIESSDNETSDMFYTRYNRICMEMRKKYKLITCK